MKPPAEQAAKTAMKAKTMESQNHTISSLDIEELKRLLDTGDYPVDSELIFNSSPRGELARNLGSAVYNYRCEKISRRKLIEIGLKLGIQQESMAAILWELGLDEEKVRPLLPTVQ